MSATTEYVLTAALNVQQAEQAGVFGVVNRSTGGQVVTVTALSARGHETITLKHVGDSVNFDLAGVRGITITADSYPCNILLLNTPVGMSLTAAPVVTLAPAPPGAKTFHADVTIVAAGTTTLYTPTVGSRFVLTSIIISTDTAQRVMVIDGTDVAGKRLVGGYFSGNGGIAITGDAWQSTAINNLLRVVTTVLGNVFVAVEGYETS